MKKVLFVATVVKSHIMTFHIPHLKWFKENGYETYVCARNDYKNKNDCVIPYCDQYFDIPFERSPFKFKNYQVYRQLREVINQHEFDVIHCHTPMGGGLARLASRQVRKNNTTVLYTAHGFHFYTGGPILNWLLYYPIEKWLAKYTDVLITINEEDYHRAQSFKAKKVKYVPGVGIDINRFKEVSVNKKDKRQEIGIPDNGILILSVGELNKNKNHETIIRALAKLNNKNIYYVICGEGLLEGNLIRLAEELGIKEQVKLLGYRNDIAELNKVADIFALPSFREGLSLSLMEAMSSGLPVICSSIRGNKDLIDHGKGGLLIEPNHIKGFAEAINQLVVNQSIRKVLGQYNQEKIKKFEFNNVISQITKIYLENEAEVKNNRLAIKSRKHA